MGKGSQQQRSPYSPPTAILKSKTTAALSESSCNLLIINKAALTVTGQEGSTLNQLNQPSKFPRTLRALRIGLAFEARISCARSRPTPAFSSTAPAGAPVFRMEARGCRHRQQRQEQWQFQPKVSLKTSYKANSDSKERTRAGALSAQQPNYLLFVRRPFMLLSMGVNLATRFSQSVSEAFTGLKLAAACKNGWGQPLSEGIAAERPGSKGTRALRLVVDLQLPASLQGRVCEWTDERDAGG